MSNKTRSSNTWQRIRYRAHMAGLRAANMLRDLGISLPPRGRIVFHPDYVITGRTWSARHAFDPRRPQRILDQLHEVGVLGEGMVLTPEPATEEQLRLVHTEDFLAEIRDPGRLAELLFMRPDELCVTDPLGPFLLQAGGTVLACKEAVEGGVPVFNLGGGFHHAQRDRAEGLCPINDVAVAIKVVQQEDIARRVLVVDLDYHQGNGTALIFRGDESVFTLSVHGQSWSQVEGKQNTLDLELPEGVEDGPYLEAVRGALDQAFQDFRPHLAIYLAGADVHREDTLGGFALTEEGILVRDMMVLSYLEERAVPVAVTLAGGYWPMAWSTAFNCIYSQVTGIRIHPALRPTNIRSHFRRRRKTLDPAMLRQGALLDLDAAGLEDLMQNKSGSGLFLDYYSEEGMQFGLEHYGLFALLRERGFEDLRLAMDTEDPYRQVLRLYFDKQDREHLLIEIVARFRTLSSPREAVDEGAEETYRMVSIEWMTMQNPREDFTLERRRLPGQTYPGLGIGRWMVELLRLMAERLKCTGLMNIPRHYHNAYLYSKQMLCFDPEDQGYLEAMKRDLRTLSLVETSEAIDAGALREAGHEGALLWEGKAQVMPVQPVLNEFFVRPGYIQAVAAAREKYKFSLAT